MSEVYQSWTNHSDYIWEKKNINETLLLRCLILPTAYWPQGFGDGNMLIEKY